MYASFVIYTVAKREGDIKNVRPSFSQGGDQESRPRAIRSQVATTESWVFLAPLLEIWTPLLGKCAECLCLNTSPGNIWVSQSLLALFCSLVHMNSDRLHNSFLHRIRPGIMLLYPL